MLFCTRPCAKFSFRVCRLRLVPSTRSFLSNPTRFSESEDYWRRQDSVSKNWELIYKSPIDKPIAAFSTFATIAPIILVGCGIYCSVSSRDLDEPIVLPNSDVVVADNMYEFSIYIAAFVLLHIIVKIFISRFVIRMYKHEDKYLAVFKGHLYHQNRQWQFSKEDFKRMKTALVVPWGESRYHLGHQKGIILSEYFKTPWYLNELLKNK